MDTEDGKEYMASSRGWLKNVRTKHTSGIRVPKGFIVELDYTAIFGKNGSNGEALCQEVKFEDDGAKDFRDLTIWNDK